ncbi:MAG: FHA domain-containing protein, partial [bacterium]
MEALLQVTSGQRAGQEVAIESGEVFSIGRSAESDLQLLELGVSRFHCVVEAQADHLVLTDLNSSNGTFVNGERMKRQALAEGDEIAVGTVKLVVARLAEPPRAPAESLLAGCGEADVRMVRDANPHETLLLRSDAQP